MNIFVSSFDKTAEAARLLYVYGCFSNVDFDDPQIREKINNSLINSDSGYRSKCDPIVKILEGLIKKCRNKASASDKGKQQKYISPDRFDDVSGLVDIYRLKKIKSMDNTISNYIDYCFKLSDPNYKTNSEYSKKEFKEYFGDNAKNETIFIFDTENKKFSKEELSQLYSALMFFNGKAPYSVPGFMACDRINDYLKLLDEDEISDDANAVFNYNNIDRVLNDNAVYSIFEAIKKKSDISFFFRKLEIDQLKKSDKGSESNDQYVSSKITCHPLKVMYEFQNGRGYLIAWSYNLKCIRIFRLDDIFEAELIAPTEDMTDEKVLEIENLCRSFTEKLWLSASDKKSMNISVDFDVNAEQIRCRIPLGTVTPLTDSSCRLDAEMLNFKDIVPFIRCYGDKAHVSKEKSPELYEYIKSDLEEALKKYGVV